MDVARGPVNSRPTKIDKMITYVSRSSSSLQLLRILYPPHKFSRAQIHVYLSFYFKISCIAFSLFSICQKDGRLLDTTPRHMFVVDLVAESIVCGEPVPDTKSLPSVGFCRVVLYARHSLYCLQALLFDAVDFGGKYASTDFVQAGEQAISEAKVSSTPPTTNNH